MTLTKLKNVSNRQILLDFHNQNMVFKLRVSRTHFAVVSLSEKKATLSLGLYGTQVTRATYQGLDCRSMLDRARFCRDPTNKGLGWKEHPSAGGEGCKPLITTTPTFGSQKERVTFIAVWVYPHIKWRVSFDVPVASPYLLKLLDITNILHRLKKF